MYRYLLDHPRVLPCKVKEPQYFSHSAWYRWRHWQRYQSLFPEIGSAEPITLDWFVLDDQGELSKQKVIYHRHSDGEEVTGEASANTFAQVPPRLLRTYFPEAKLIVLLRNPSERAYSHYRMFERFKKEGRRLPFRLTNFEQDVQDEIKALANGKRTYFIEPGIYHHRLRQWFAEFGGKQIHVIFTENLVDIDTAVEEMNRLCQFLNIEEQDFKEILKLKFNRSPASEMSRSVRKVLDHFYESENVKLKNLLHCKLPWK